ncbi:uncharacterized protein METZ01_LOCUS493125, partial [marine metagenome]
MCFKQRQSFSRQLLEISQEAELCRTGFDQNYLIPAR